jgi:2-oxoisovalerate dehydrogenase E1 component alpha subunit
MTPRSRLHVPSPPARPGQEPDFSYVQISPAGAVNRPDVTASARDIENLSLELVRVLDDDHRAVGAWNPHLEAPELQVALRHMLLTRLFDDRMQRIQRQGRISFYIKSTGEEAVAVAAGMALTPGDMLFPSYRQQGLQVVRGRNLVDLMCQCLSNTRDMCKGRQMPIMYHWAQGNIFSVSGNLATQFPQAVGWAMAAAIKGEDNIAAGWIGEGSSAEADFHYAMTFAAVYQAPVILNLVNNQWAISTFQGFAGGEHRTFAQRGPGYGIPGIRVDGNDFLAVYAVTQRRPLALPSQGGMARLALGRSDHAPQGPPDHARRVVRGASDPAASGARGLRHRLLEGGRVLRHAHPRADARSAQHVRRCLQGNAGESRAPACGAARPDRKRCGTTQR